MNNISNNNNSDKDPWKVSPDQQFAYVAAAAGEVAAVAKLQLWSNCQFFTRTRDIRCMDVAAIVADVCQVKSATITFDRWQGVTGAHKNGWLDHENRMLSACIPHSLSRCNGC